MPRSSAITRNYEKVISPITESNPTRALKANNNCVGYIGHSARRRFNTTYTELVFRLGSKLKFIHELDKLTVASGYTVRQRKLREFYAGRDFIEYNGWLGWKQR